MKIQHHDIACQCTSCSTRLPKFTDLDEDRPAIGKPILPLIVARWARGTNDTVIIKIDRFKGRVVIDIRAWWTSHNGELRAGRSGITMAARHLPALAHALTKAESAARELSLLPEQDDA